jgi:hypothetical protein
MSKLSNRGPRRGEGNLDEDKEPRSGIKTRASSHRVVMTSSTAAIGYGQGANRVHDAADAAFA